MCEREENGKKVNMALSLLLSGMHIHDLYTVGKMGF